MAAVIPCYNWQSEVFEGCQNPNIQRIAAVGTRGPGKSWMCREVNVARALQMPGTNHIIFRRTSDDVTKQYEVPLRELLTNYHGAKVPYNYNQQKKVFTIGCPRGGTSRIFLGFAEYLKHAEKYMSMEYATASFDEVTHFEEIIPQLIAGSVRGVPNTKLLYFGNPGGIGHSWVKSKIVRPETRLPNSLVLFPRLEDNLWIKDNDPQYKERTGADLPEWKRAQWFDGDWDTNEGAYFAAPSGCFRFMNPPQWADWWAGVDWGYSPSAFAVAYAATWRDPFFGTHHCHVFADLKRHKLNDDQQAKEAMDVEESLPGMVRARFADPMTGKKDTSDSADQNKTTARTWAKYGFHTIPAKRRGRVPGWSLLRQFLAPIDGYSPDTDNPHGVLTISPNCVSLRRELEDAVFEQQGSGDVTGDDIDKSSEDHLLDALRYLITMVYNMTFPVPVEQILPPRAAITA